MDAWLEEGPQLVVLVLKKQVQKADRASEADHQLDTRARGGGRQTPQRSTETPCGSR